MKLPSERNFSIGICFTKQVVYLIGSMTVIGLPDDELADNAKGSVVTEASLRRCPFLRSSSCVRPSRIKRNGPSVFWLSVRGD